MSSIFQCDYTSPASRPPGCDCSPITGKLDCRIHGPKRTEKAMAQDAQVKAILRLVNTRIRALKKLLDESRYKPVLQVTYSAALDEAEHLRELIKRELEKKDG